MSQPKIPKTPSDPNPTHSTVPIVGGGNPENVRVVVRCRPLSRKESERSCAQIVDVELAQKTISVRNPQQQPTSSQQPLPDNASAGALTSDPKCFTFDSVFPPQSSQADVYNEVARPIVENVLQGYNGTIFAYGQTGTGKTHTMEGVVNVPELKGIIPNSFAQIFSHIANAGGDTQFLVRCSYLEIYNEDVRDLLSKQSGSSGVNKLEVKENKDRGVYVKDLSSFVVRNEDDMDKIMSIGNKNRSVASTNMNSVSSRSHAIFTITVESSVEHSAGHGSGGVKGQGSGSDVEGGSGRSIRVGKLNLVDLAGSERLSKTQATGDRLKEATKINLSLSNLGNVISALVDGSSHVPYRNSKLTRLLQDSLGGNSKTVMVANVGPADYNYDETVSTLRFANRAKNIKNHAIINEDPKDALLRQFEKELQDLRRQLGDELAKAQADAASASGDAELPPGDDELAGYNLETSTGINAPDEEALLGIKDELETQMKLSSNIGNESQDRKTVISALQEKVMTWKHTEEQKHSLQQRLKSLQRKILVGGENLLEKSQAQEELLLRSMKEISLRKEEERQLEEHLIQQEEERLALEAQVLACQEQNLGVSKKIKKVYSQYTVQKNELRQVKLEYQEETDALMEDVHRLSRELQYHNVLIDNFIPPMYQKLIEKSVKWHPDGGEWSLKCVAYAGNNMTRASGTRPSHSIHNHGKSEASPASIDLSGFYLDIEDDSVFQEFQNQSVPGQGHALDSSTELMAAAGMMSRSSSSGKIGKRPSTTRGSSSRLKTADGRNTSSRNRLL